MTGQGKCLMTMEEINCKAVTLMSSTTICRALYGRKGWGRTSAMPNGNSFDRYCHQPKPLDGLEPMIGAPSIAFYMCCALVVAGRICRSGMVAR
jgi:hypothetical protein